MWKVPNSLVLCLLCQNLENQNPRVDSYEEKELDNEHGYSTLEKDSNSTSVTTRNITSTP